MRNNVPNDEESRSGHLLRGASSLVARVGAGKGARLRTPREVRALVSCTWRLLGCASHPQPCRRSVLGSGGRPSCAPFFGGPRGGVSLVLGRGRGGPPRGGRLRRQKKRCLAVFFQRLSKSRWAYSASSLRRWWSRVSQRARRDRACGAVGTLNLGSGTILQKALRWSALGQRVVSHSLRPVERSFCPKILRNLDVNSSSHFIHSFHSGSVAQEFSTF